MLLRLGELILFGLLPFLAGSIAASGYEVPEDDAVVESTPHDELEKRETIASSIETGQAHSSGEPAA